jgi:hypothetical protein
VDVVERILTFIASPQSPTDEVMAKIKDAKILSWGLRNHVK